MIDFTQCGPFIHIINVIYSRGIDNVMITTMVIYLFIIIVIIITSISISTIA